MKKIKFNIVIVTGAVSIVLALITAYFLFNYTLGQITRFQNFNNKLIPLVVKTNIDIDRTNDAYGRLIHFITFKPAEYKTNIKKVSAALRLSIYKTDGDYKSLFILIKGRRLNALYKNRLYSLINKAYFKWKNVSKPILSLTAVSYNLIPPIISKKYPDKYAVKTAFIPMVKLFGLILSSGKKALSVAILVFITGSIIIIALLVLVIYLINKFVGSIKITEQRLRELSEHDALTGIYNRRYFDDKLAELLNIALRYKRPLSLIMFDIDRFKDINDEYGHETGDLILKDLSVVVKEELRNTDFFARYGGEEFMVMASETPLGMAKELAERIRLKVEKHDFKIGQTVTCSFGATEVIKDDTSQSIIYRVDSALYEAKETGRNRVCV